MVSRLSAMLTSGEAPMLVSLSRAGSLGQIRA